jgi:hypothetical protein
VLLLLLALSSCQTSQVDQGAPAKSASQQPVLAPQKKPAPAVLPVPAPAPRAPESPANVTTDEEDARTETTTFDLDGTKVLVTQKDGEAILRALLTSLASSELARRDELIAFTKNASVTPEQDVVRMGGWILFADDTKLALQYRLPPTPAGIEAYGAKVEKVQGVWSVSPVSMQHIHRRR